MTRIILPILLIYGICGLIAQETGSHFKEQHIRIGTGFSKFIIQDDIVSPMAYKGLTIPIWLDYKEVTHKYINNLSAFFSKSDLRSDIPDDFSNHHSKIITGCLGYSLLRKVYTSKSVQINAYAGGKWETFINYRKHYYARYSNEIFADINSSLDIQFSLVKKFDKMIDRISYNLNSPLITFAASPNQYNIKVTGKNYGIVFPARLFEFQSELGIFKSINKNIAIGISNFIHYYSFRKHNDNRPAKYFNNQIVSEAIFTF